MSRRADTPVPVLNNAKRAPESTPPPRAEAVAPSVPEDAPQLGPIPKGQFFATKQELDEALTASKKLGKCVVCGCKIGNGFAGHIAKCLRYSKFKTASIPTS
jgi:hypothetical protein